MVYRGCSIWKPEIPSGTVFENTTNLQHSIIHQKGKLNSLTFLSHNATAHNYSTLGPFLPLMLELPGTNYHPYQMSNSHLTLRLVHGSVRSMVSTLKIGKGKKGN